RRQSQTMVFSWVALSLHGKPPSCLGWRHANGIQRSAQVAHRAISVVPFVQTKQSNAESLKVRPFIALQRHAGSGLQTNLQKLLAALNAWVRGVADHHARCLEAFCCHAGETT